MKIAKIWLVKEIKHFNRIYTRIIGVFNYFFVYEAQEVVFRYIKPGITPNSHHTGHNIGVLGHEGPFIDLGDTTVIQEGMVFTVEPGIYVPGLGGFRHSDTVVVTKDGIEMLTYYPRDLNSLIC